MGQGFRETQQEITDRLRASAARISKHIHTIKNAIHSALAHPGASLMTAAAIIVAATIQLIERIRLSLVTQRIAHAIRRQQQEAAALFRRGGTGAGLGGQNNVGLNGQRPAAANQGPRQQPAAPQAGFAPGFALT